MTTTLVELVASLDQIESMDMESDEQLILVARQDAIKQQDDQQQTFGQHSATSPTPQVPSSLQHMEENKLFLEQLVLGE